MSRNRNRIIDLPKKVIDVDHVSMIPARRDLLYSGADISLHSAHVAGVDIQHKVYSFFLPLYLCIYITSPGKSHTSGKR